MPGGTLRTAGQSWSWFILGLLAGDGHYRQPQNSIVLLEPLSNVVRIEAAKVQPDGYPRYTFLNFGVAPWGLDSYSH
jgi:hypothetical protein